MTRITRMLTGLLLRSAWLLAPSRAEWIEGLVAEASEPRAGPRRVAWLLGGVWLLAEEVLRRSAVRVLMFVAAAGVVLWVAWPGRSSDSAVLINRIEIPLYLALLALLPLLVRRFCGPVRDGLLPRAVRVVGYLVVLALVTGTAVEARQGQKLGAYFAYGGKFTGLMVLLLVCYAAAILIITSQRVRLTRSVLPIAIGAGTLAGVVLYARYGFRLDTPPLGWWELVALALPFLIGFAVTRLAARGTPAKRMSPAGQGVLVAVCAACTAVVLLMPPVIFILGFFLIPPALFLVPGLVARRPGAQDDAARGMAPAAQGGLAAVCATGTAALLLAALTTVTIALAPQRVPLQTPPPPANGGCETCDPNNLVIPPGLRHEYWVGLSIAQADLPYYIALIFAPMFAVFGGGVGVGLGEASLRTRNRFDSARAAPPSAPSQTQA
ncbi:MAG: hypothetical protein ACLP0J_08735 [Solirubrobacteraceae bacterium]